MARQSGQNVDIRISATDAASPVLKGVGQTFQRMPEMFGKAAGAMRLVETASSQMGGQVANAVGKISGLASMVAVGGPVGIGIAALTAGIAAGSWAWKKYNETSEESKRAMQSMLEAIKPQTDALNKLKESIEKTIEETRKLGQLPGELKVFEAYDEIANSEEKLTAAQKKRASLQAEYAAQEEKNYKAAFIAGTANDERAKRELATIGDRLIAAGLEEETLRLNLLHQNELLTTLKDQESKQHSLTKAKDDTKAADDRRREADRKEKEEKRLQAEQAKRDHLDRLGMLSELAMMAKEGSRQRKEEAASAIEEEAKAERKRTEEFKQQQQQRRAAIMSVASSVGNILGDAFQQMASGQKKASEAMRDAVVQSAETAINAYAAAGAAAAAAGNSAIPIIGWIGAGVAASIVFGLIKGYLGRVPKAEGGYMLRGGQAGIDSVLVNAQAGEGVLSRQQTAAIIRLADRVERMERRGAPVAAGGGGGNVFNFPQLIPGGSAETTRAVRKAMKIEARLRSRGHG